MIGRPRATTGEAQQQKAREAWRRYYEAHREERLLKLALKVPTEEVKERRRAAYHRMMDARDAVTGVPRRMGRPTATKRQRIEAVLARSEAYPEIAAALRLELAELDKKENVE